MPAARRRRPHPRGAQPAIVGAVFTLSFLAAYLIRCDGGLSRVHLLQVALWVPLLVAGRFLLQRKLGVHRFLWHFMCLSDAIVIARSL